VYYYKHIAKFVTTNFPLLHKFSRQKKPWLFAFSLTFPWPL